MPSQIAVGKPTPLIDGRAKVAGLLRFAPDMQMPDLLHARFVISPYAHAKIHRIDKTAALAVPGVAAVLTAADLPVIAPSNRARLLLARDRVIFVGQPVALVLATSEAAAEDGVERVQVEYEPLPAAITIDEALAPGAPLVWPDGMPGENDDGSMHGAASDGAKEVSTKPSNIADHSLKKRGDITKGFAESDVIVERTFTTPVVHQSYLEPQAVIVQPDPFTGGLTVWASTQGTFLTRRDVADVVGIPESEVRVIGTPVGGGFGGKLVLYEPLVALAARLVGRPVKLVLTRLEELAAGNPAPAIRIKLRVGAKRDGTLSAIDTKIEVNSGCYPTGYIGGVAASEIASNYRIANFSVEITDILTFRVSSSAYRAPGAPSGCFAMETVMEELAQALNMDSFEFRLKNAVKPGDLMNNNKPWGNMGMIQVLEALRQHPAWQQREAARQAGRGVGIAVGGWNPGTEGAAAGCMVDRDGTLQIHVASADLSGTTTTFALMAAEVFGVPVEQIRVKIGDTASAPYAGESAGSKTTYSVGPAVIEAAREARTQVLAIASDELEADPADLEIVDGMVRVRGVPERAVPLKEIAEKTTGFGGKYPPIFGRGRHVDPVQSPSFCAQLAEVEVDRETGFVQVHRLVIAQDVGRAINPLAVEGQLMGGATQGLGWALYEQIAYDEQGQLLTGSWMDYAVPATTQAAGTYETILVEIPSEHGPFGARGVGEPPVIPTAAAVANAIADAAQVRLTDLPMTAPRVLAALTQST